LKIAEVNQDYCNKCALAIESPNQENGSLKQKELEVSSTSEEEVKPDIKDQEDTSEQIKRIALMWKNYDFNNFNPEFFAT